MTEQQGYELLNHAVKLLADMDAKEEHFRGILKKISQQRQTPQIPENMDISDFFVSLSEAEIKINEAIEIIKNHRSDFMKNEQTALIAGLASSVKEFLR